MAIVVPTRTAGSLGTAKSNSTPVTNEPQQLDASDYNTCADKLIEVINQSNTSVGDMLTEIKADSLGSVFSIDVTTLPANSDLLVSWRTREVGVIGTHLSFQVNVDTGTNYSSVGNLVKTVGGGSLQGNGTGLDHLNFGGVIDDSGLANRWGWGRALIPDYKNAANNVVTWGRSFVNETAAIARYDIFSGSHDVVGALTSIEIKNASGGLFVIGSTVSVLAVPQNTIGL